jgi:hypothetical protein
MNIRPVEAQLFHEDRHRQTDMKKVTLAFSNFMNAPKGTPYVPTTAPHPPACPFVNNQ